MYIQLYYRTGTKRGDGDSGSEIERTGFDMVKKLYLNIQSLWSVSDSTVEIVRYHRPVTLLSVLVFRGEGRSITTDIVEARGRHWCDWWNEGGGRGFYFWKVDRDFFNFSKICPFKTPDPTQRDVGGSKFSVLNTQNCIWDFRLYSHQILTWEGGVL